jgi:hypothetical protein
MPFTRNQARTYRGTWPFCSAGPQNSLSVSSQVPSVANDLCTPPSARFSRTCTVGGHTLAMTHTKVLVTQEKIFLQQTVSWHREDQEREKRRNFCG